jgi:hypothetical protein
LIGEEGIRVEELQSRARAKCNIGGLERWGWISVGDGGTTRRDGYGSHRGVKRDTVVRPTPAGVYARALWPRALSDVGRRWRTRFGSDVIDALRDALLAVVTSMPWSPPEVRPGDGFRTHIVEGDSLPDDPPLMALVGQVLTAFTLDHEMTAQVSLPLGANVLRVMQSGLVRIRDLPALSGLSKEGISMAIGFLQRSGLAISAPGRAVELTRDGHHALDNYWQLSNGTNDQSLRAALEAVVGQRDALAAGLVPPAGCWRGDKPYLAQRNDCWRIRVARCHGTRWSYTEARGRTPVRSRVWRCLQ